jgi:hypothetical protein
MDDEKNVEMENARTVYREVCQNHRAITDFRGKLLALLPVVSGVGLYLLIFKKASPSDLNPRYLVAIGIFGFVVTVGLFLHEIRAIEKCGELIEVGRSLEVKMGLTSSQEWSTTTTRGRVASNILSTTSKVPSERHGLSTRVWPRLGCWSRSSVSLIFLAAKPRSRPLKAVAKEIQLDAG